MAIKVLKFVNGIPKEINSSVDSIAAKSFFVGGSEGTGTELTKTILDALRGGGDASSLHNHDTQYYTKATTYNKSEIDSLVGSGGAGLAQEVQDRTDADAALGERIDDAEDAIALKASQASLNQEIADREQGDLDVASAASADATAKANAAQAAAIADALATYIPLSQKGVNSGVATLDSNGKILVSQLAAIAITEVSVVANIAARDALVIGPNSNEIQEGDVAVVIDADGSGNKSSFIYTGSAWVSLNDGTVISVNGQTGSVVLSTSDIAEGSNLYYTQSRFNTAFAAKSTSDLAEGSNLYFTNARAQSAVAADISAAVAAEAQFRFEQDDALDEKIDSTIASEVIARDAAIAIEAAARSAADAAEVVARDTAIAAAAAAVQATASADATAKVAAAKAEIMGGIPDSMFDTIKEIADELASDNTATGVILSRLDVLESSDVAQAASIALKASQADLDAETNRAIAAEALKSDIHFSLPTAVEDIVIGDLIVARYNGSSQVEAYKASSAAADNADFNNGKWAVVGSAASATSSVVLTVSIKKAIGDIATVSFDSAPTLADAGKSVYLGSNGKATLTPPSAAESGIVYIGALASATQVFLVPAQLRGVNGAE